MKVSFFGTYLYDVYNGRGRATKQVRLREFYSIDKLSNAKKWERGSENPIILQTAGAASFNHGPLDG